MRRTVIYFLFFLSFYQSVQAQIGKEAYHWQFGQNAALDFSSGKPVAGTSKINIHEGCASISDPNTGQLLFYTDGDSVWDRNNNRMPNGVGMINGQQGTTTQAATIVPKPGCNNIYYVITADCESLPNQGIHYSILDMNLNGGLGDIFVKNLLLTPPSTTEKVVATRHCNGVDYWILTHPYGSNNFNAYLVTWSGIDTIPVVSSVGTVITQNAPNCCFGAEGVGYLKASPNGKRLASCVTIFSPNPFVEIYNFDNSTGQVSNPITIPIVNIGGYYNGSYGCSFSPDNTKLYVNVSGDALNNVLQYDLSSGNPNTIISTCYTLSTIQAYALQLAPDGKIYVADGNDSIGVINYPNNSGSACNFQGHAVALSSGTSSIAGLPNFIDGGLNTKILNIPDIIMCDMFSNDTVDAGSGFLHYYWSTGDTTQKIIIKSPGTYWVNVTNSNGCIASDTFKAYTISSTNFNTLHDTIICTTNDKYYANAFKSGILNYSWNDGSTMPANTFTASGIYWVDYTFKDGCVIRDSMKLTLFNKPNVHLGNDTVYCGNVSLPIIIDAGKGQGYTYYWSTGANTQTISVYAGGMYSVNVSSSTIISTSLFCYSSDTIVLGIDNTSYFDVLRDTSICESSQFPITLNAAVATTPGSYNYYAWVGGHIGAQLTVNAPGTYIVNISIKDVNSNGVICKARDTAVVTIGCSGIEQLTGRSERLTVWPNPANNSLQVAVSGGQIAGVRMYDVLGNAISAGSVELVATSAQIDISSLTNGVYFVEVKTIEGSYTKKINVQH